MMSFGEKLRLRGLGWVTLGGDQIQQAMTVLILKAEEKILMIGAWVERVRSRLGTRTPLGGQVGPK